jgi:hypothetical protein
MRGMNVTLGSPVADEVNITDWATRNFLIKVLNSNTLLDVNRQYIRYL